LERTIPLMHETEERVPSTPYLSRLWLGGLFGLGCLVAGVVIGRAFFPLEVPKPFVVEKEKRVEVPVERIVEKRVEVPVDRIVEKRVEVPVDRIIEKRVEVPVEVIKYVDRMVPVEKIVYRDRLEPVAPPVTAWDKVTQGLSEDEVRQLLGEPRRIEPGESSYWYYGDEYFVKIIIFIDGKVDWWSQGRK